MLSTCMYVIRHALELVLRDAARYSIAGWTHPTIKTWYSGEIQFYYIKVGFKGKVRPEVLGIQGEGLFIFRDLGRRAIYFQ